MAVNKRAKKKRPPARKRSTSRKRGQANQQRWPLLQTLLAVLILVLGAIIATYYFGSFELRAKMERIAIRTIHAARAPESMPRPIVSALNRIYDTMPESQGLVVEGGELGHEETPLIAGVPLSSSPIRVLRNKSYLNLYNERQRQSRCVAFKLNERDQHTAKLPNIFFEDPRIRQLSTHAMQLGKWTPQPIAPVAALAHAFGAEGANEAHLVTNLAPMTDDFAQGLWQRLIHELAVTYPKRFGEIWIYAGPVIHAKSSKLASGVPIPDSFYAIAFDLTETGGLRAIAFLVPQDAKDSSLRSYITSISRIEQQTGLQFLPEVDYHAREVIGSAVSPQLW